MAERLLIDHVGQRGDGVAYSDGATIFTPYTLPGEIVETAPSPGHPDRRQLVRVEQPSPERIAPFCEYFGTCGGCAIQHWQAEPYRIWKRALVLGTLAHAGIDAEVDELIDAHGAGRRRAVFHARRNRDGTLHVGFAAAGSHEIVTIAQCPILDPTMSGALDAAREFAETLRPTDKPLDIQVTGARNGLDIDVRGSGPLSSSAMMALSQVAERRHIARLTRHGELVLMREPPMLAIGKAELTLPPGSFLQATAAGEAALAALVVQHCKGAKHVADLFCGVGPFALRLAERLHVTALDSYNEAVDALQKAARNSRGLKPIKAEARDLFRRPLMAAEMRDFDAVVFDPPRQGAQAQATQLAASKVPVVVAVSCNAATFARDAAILIGGGYRIGRVTPVDQFRHTPHVELVARFAR